MQSSDSSNARSRRDLKNLLARSVAYGELGQFDKRLTDSIVSLRNEMTALRGEMIVRIDGVGAAVNTRIDGVDARLDSVNTRIDVLASQMNTRIDSLTEQVNTRIDALTQRVDDALNIRERLVALEAKFVARNS